MSKSLLASTYAPRLSDRKACVSAAHVKARLSVNRELISPFWYIGREILNSPKAGGRGTKVVERLAKDVAAEFPEMGGFAYTNVKRMRTFAEANEAIEISPQAVGLLKASKVESGIGSRNGEAGAKGKSAGFMVDPDPEFVRLWIRHQGRVALYVSLMPRSASTRTARRHRIIHLLNQIPQHQQL